jgi:hypothetical protein
MQTNPAQFLVREATSAAASVSPLLLPPWHPRMLHGIPHSSLEGKQLSNLAVVNVEGV